MTVEVSARLEITQNPLSFGLSTVSLNSTGLNLIPTIPGWRLHANVPFTIPGQTGDWIAAMIGTPESNAEKISVHLSASSHLKNPIPAPTVDADGFAIHKVEFTGTVPLILSKVAA